MKTHRENPLCPLTDGLLELISTGEISNAEVETQPFRVKGGIMATAKIRIRVHPPDLIARDDEAETAYQTPVTIDVLANDEDPMGQPIRISRIVIQPPQEHGSAAIHDDRQAIVFAPKDGFVGDVMLEYEIERVPNG